MRFTAEDYREAAGERFNEANGAFQRGDHLAAHLAAGLAIECMLRAYRVRVSPDFEERHDLALLSAAYLRRMPVRQKEELRDEINEATILWQNNHRYGSSRKLVAYLNRIGRYRRERDMLRANATRMLDAARRILDYGEERWPDSNTPTP